MARSKLARGEEMDVKDFVRSLNHSRESMRRERDKAIAERDAALRRVAELEKELAAARSDKWTPQGGDVLPSAPSTWKLRP